MSESMAESAEEKEGIAIVTSNSNEATISFFIITLDTYQKWFGRARGGDEDQYMVPGIGCLGKSGSPPAPPYIKSRHYDGFNFSGGRYWI